MKNRDLIGLILVAFFLGAMTVLLTFFVAHAADAPPQDPLKACQSDLGVINQYAIQQNHSRNTTEQDLARANARINDLETELSKFKMTQPAPIPPKPEAKK